MPGLDPLEAALKAYKKAEPPSSVSFIDPVLYLEPVGVNPEKGKAKVVVVDWVDSVVDPAVSV